MVLEDKQILDLIGKPQNTHIEDYISKHETLDLYFNGGDTIAEELAKITNFENASQLTLREKYARSPKDVVHRLLKPFHKVFSASGGSQVVDIDVTNRKDEFTEHLAKLPEGISLNKWMEDYWMEAYVTDPNGIIFIEADEEGMAYPSYKSIRVIHDYTLTWNKFNYLIMDHGEITLDPVDTHENGEVVRVYRVVDDAKDGLYYIKDKELIPHGKVINHNKGFVPAILTSDIMEKKTGGRRSFINKIDEMLAEYLRESSVLSVFKFLHAYPKYWQYVGKCTTCHGTGKVEDSSDATKKVTCPSCNGKRYNTKTDVSDGIMLPLPKMGDDPVVAPNVAGFATPPIETWDKMGDDLDKQEKRMEFAIIGTHVEREKSNTATGRFLDEQPVDTALHAFSETEEQIKQTVAHYMARWMYGDEYGKVTIKNGKRFVFEHPDTLWNKYVDARDRKSPTATLDYLYQEYLRSEYQNDEPMFEQKLKEFHIEPMVHYTIEQLNSISTLDMSLQIGQKLCFSDWLATSPEFSKDIESLRKEFLTYFNENKDEIITRVESASPEGQDHIGDTASEEDVTG